MTVAYSGPGTTGILTTYFGHDDGLGDGGGRAPNRTQSDLARTAFLAALTGISEYGFEDQVHATPAPIVATFPGAGTATLTGGGSVRETTSPTEEVVGRYNIAGTTLNQDGVGFRFDMSGSNVLTLSTDIYAFGFYGVDIGDFGAQLRLVFGLVGGGTATWDPPHMINTSSPGVGIAPYGGSVLYAGAISSTPFTTVTFLNDTANPFLDGFAFDGFTIAALAQLVTPPTPTTCGRPLIVNPCPQMCPVTVPTATVVSPTGVGTWATVGGLATCGAALIVNPSTQFVEVA